ncbi:GDSL esterase/lipase At5g55050-like [Syzygium oleosum]|uniref:GDSL esterase/lipase At5g55050-like n=1 Tax=Syzygium oleosum TaxID=219896 RepID=UPI0024BA18BE|nr:GDSL esterase/lipase At5g55050-like [Syzygium oleosum]
MTMVILLRIKADKLPIFLFGDSTMDVGTNNFLPGCKARADISFYGIGSRGSRPTGRFSNGYNTADALARLMGHKRSPRPFLSLITQMSNFKRNVLTGVNFASGGSGIMDTTGKKFGRVIPFGEQVEQYATVRNNITELMGTSRGKTMLSNSLFVISVGSNDIFDYFESSQSRSPEFLVNLGNQYEAHLKNLARLGARRFGIISIPPIGCVPIQRLRGNGSGGCMQDINDYAEAFLAVVKGVLPKLKSEHQGVQFSLGNAYLATMSIINITFPFKEVQKACCGNGTLNTESACSPTARVCRNREDYLFWDQFHPTQAAAKLAAAALFAGSPPLVAPLNFSSVARIYV